MRQGFLYSDQSLTSATYHNGVLLPAGLSDDIFDTFNIIDYNKETFNDDIHPVECCICMLDFEQGVITDGGTTTSTTINSILETPGCKHVFHKECLKSWLVNHRVCPLCRNDLGLSAVGAGGAAAAGAGGASAADVGDVELGVITAAAAAGGNNDAAVVLGGSEENV
jgi:hypothetical protein